MAAALVLTPAPVMSATPDSPDLNGRIYSNPRLDACSWHDSARAAETRWRWNWTYRWGGYCVKTWGTIPEARKAECVRVVKARRALGFYRRWVRNAQIVNYCYVIRGTF